MRNTILIAIFVLTLAACGPTASVEPTFKSGGESGLAGTSWVLVEIRGGPPVEGARITLNFAESEISGKACNNYLASYTASPKELNYADGLFSVTGLSSTDMACTDPAGMMEEEQMFFNILRLMSAYRITDDGRLILEHPTMDPCCLYFVPAEDVPDLANIVSGTSWAVTQLNSDALLPDTEITMTFDGEQIRGNAGCNTYSTTYVLGQSNTIELGPVTMTRMACSDPESVMEQEILFVQVLDSIKSISRYDVELVMTNGDGTSSLRLSPVKDPTINMLASPREHSPASSRAPTTRLAAVAATATFVAGAG